MGFQHGLPGKEGVKPGKAAKVPLSEKQLDILQQIVRQSIACVRLVQRCRMILLGFEGRLNEDIAVEVNLHRGRSACGDDDGSNRSRR